MTREKVQDGLSHAGSKGGMTGSVLVENRDRDHSNVSSYFTSGI